MTQTAQQLITTIKAQANPEKVKHSQRFFKTGPGEYGEGDIFLGLTNPQQHAITKQFKKQITLNDLAETITSPYHEVRLTSLLLLVELFKQAKKDPHRQKKIIDFYLKHTNYINNWDLVDLSAHKTLGLYLFQQDPDQTPKLLLKLAKSKMLWERRISIISTFPFVKSGNLKPTLELSEMLLKDQEDLMHKAVGWLLREVGKKDQAILEKFLQKHKLEMPRTMLRYAIEKFSPEKRKFYLQR